MGAALVALLAGAPLTGVLSPLEAQAQSQVVEFDIPSQPIASALVVFARQAGVQLVMSEEPSGGARANAVRGALDRNTALAQLLEGTGYQARFENGAIRLRRTSANSGEPQQQGSADGLVQLAQAREAQRVVSDGTELRDARGREDESEEEIVVVGTSIRGVYPASSPVEIFTAEDIARTGATTTEQFIQKLPQNAGTRTQYNSGATPQSNREGVNGVDLRGLGVGTTLVLINGRRIALSASGQMADVSLIPLAAVERLEVLTDGASAIYGSDAIGGVVNFVLRDDLEGAETRFNYGGVTGGGMRQGGLSQTFGSRWQSGSGVLSLNYLSASALDRADRSYSQGAGPGNLTPVDMRYGAFATITEHVSERLTFNGDFVVSSRDLKSEGAGRFFSTLGEFNTSQVETEQYFANLGSEYVIDEDLRASVLLTYTRNTSDVRTLGLLSGVLTPGVWDTKFEGFDLTGSVEGSLFRSDAGAVRFSLGAGYSAEAYEASRSAAGSPSGAELARRTTYAFGEVFVPIVAETQGVPLVNRLEVSLAARYTRYDDASAVATDQDFGGEVSPKVGVVWAPVSAIRLRATYGESFRAASLTELDPSNSGHSLTNRTILGVPGSIVLQVGGAYPNLAPETATAYTIGFDLRPDWDPALRLGVTYFNIDYSDRISAGDTTGGPAARANPLQYPDVMRRGLPAAQIEELLNWGVLSANLTSVNLSNIPAAAANLAANSNFWVLDNRTRNLALSRLDGLDISASVEFDTSWGDFVVGGQATRIFDYVQQNNQATPVITVADTVLQPVDVRSRLYAGATFGPFASAFSMNYVDDYRNPFAPGGVQEVEAWKTFDLSLSYDIGGASRDDDGVSLRLNVQNISDENPPFVASGGASSPTVRLPIGYDPANANPLGRVVSFEITKRW